MSSRYFVVANDVIENIILAEEGFTLEGKTLHLADGIVGDIGWTWNNGSPTPPNTPPPDPDALFAALVETLMDKAGDLLRALALVTMDEVNILRARNASILQAAADATSLAQFKTLMGQIQTTAPRDVAQLKTAIKAKRT